MVLLTGSQRSALPQLGRRHTGQPCMLCTGQASVQMHTVAYIRQQAGRSLDPALWLGGKPSRLLHHQTSACQRRQYPARVTWEGCCRPARNSCPSWCSASGLSKPAALCTCCMVARAAAVCPACKHSVGSACCCLVEPDQHLISYWEPSMRF